MRRIDVSVVPEKFSWRRLLLSDAVPYTARATFFYELASSPLTGAYVGVLALLTWVAKQTLGASDLEVAVLIATPAAAQLFSVYWAHLMEGRPKMPWVVWPSLVSRFLILCVGFVANSWTLVVLGAIAFLVGAMSTPAGNAIWRYNYPSSHRYRAVGAVLTTLFATSLVVSLAVGWLLKTEGEWLFRVVFPIAGVLGMLGVWVYANIRVRGEGELKDLPPESKPFSFSSNFGLLRRDPRFGKFMLLQFILGFSNLMSGPALISLLKGQEADYLQASIVLNVAPSIVIVLSMPVWGRVLQKMNPWRARGWQSLLWIAGFSLIAFSGHSIGLVIAGQAVIGAALGGGNLLWSLQQMYFARKEDVPKYMGLHCSLTGIRGLIAPFVGVFLLGRIGAHGVFFAAVGGFVAAEVIALWAAHGEQREASGRGAADPDDDD